MVYLFIHSINQQGIMSSYYVTGSREVSEYEVMKKAHFLLYRILWYVAEREEPSAKITAHCDASFMSLDFIP